jgi:hypothetical protein
MIPQKNKAIPAKNCLDLPSFVLAKNIIVLFVDTFQIDPCKQKHIDLIHC